MKMNRNVDPNIKKICDTSWNYSCYGAWMGALLGKLIDASKQNHRSELENLSKTKPRAP